MPPGGLRPLAAEPPGRQQCRMRAAVAHARACARVRAGATRCSECGHRMRGQGSARAPLRIGRPAAASACPLGGAVCTQAPARAPCHPAADACVLCAATHSSGSAKSKCFGSNARAHARKWMTTVVLNRAALLPHPASSSQPASHGSARGDGRVLRFHAGRSAGHHVQGPGGLQEPPAAAGAHQGKERGVGQQGRQAGRGSSSKGGPFWRRNQHHAPPPAPGPRKS